MPYFRCTSCRRRIESPVVIGAGDCPHCGGDVVFDVHGGAAPEERTRPAGLVGRLREALRNRRRP